MSMTFGTLKSDVAAYLHRTDLTTPIADFCDKARIRIGADLRAQANYQTGTVTSFASGLSALPSNYAAMVAVTASDGTPYTFLPPPEVDYNHDSEYVYSVLGTDLFIPNAGSTTTVNIYYYTVPAALVNNSDVVDAMVEWPSLWVYAATREGAIYCHDWDLAAQMDQLYEKELEKANSQGRDARYGPAPAVVDSGRNLMAWGPNV